MSRLRAIFGSYAAARSRVKDLFQRYGWVALGVWYTIFLSTIALTALLVRFGVPLHFFGDAVASGGPWVVGYAVAKLLMAPRAALTFALTPVVARRLGRVAAEPPA